jgi:chromosome segregation ATPase
MIIEEKCAGISGSLMKCEEELAVLRTAVRDSAEEVASLRQANKDLVSEKGELLSRGDESNLLKTQVKALTHQVHMLEKKLTEGSEGFEREKEATKKRHANEITELSSAHEIALLELRRAMLSAESAKSEEVSAKHQTQLRELTKKAGDLENQLDGAEKRTAEAVADAKAKVYTKVKLQFDNGNKEFQKVKAALKEAQAEAAKHVSAVDEAQQNVVLADAKAKESDEKKVAMVEQVGVINGKINEVVQGLHKAVCLIDSNESVGEMPSLSISLTENADADASTVAAPTVSALETAVIIIAKMKTKINKVQSDLQNASQGKDSLQSAMSVLEGSLRRAESSLSIATLRSLELETRAKTAEEQLESATKELEDTVTDRDAQMTAVAQMVSSVAAHDDVVGRYKDEIKELTERCTSLRSMNEELLAMMEKA